MATLTSTRMAKHPGGRPTREEGDGGTEMVRINRDLARMIALIVRYDKLRGGKMTSAKLCDPLLRPGIAGRYETIREPLERLEKLEAEIAGLPDPPVSSPKKGRKPPAE